MDRQTSGATEEADGRRMRRMPDPAQLPAPAPHGAGPEGEADTVGHAVARRSTPQTPGPASEAGTLPPAARGDAERMLGFDFSAVRVHADATGEARASAEGAVAVTQGEDIYLPGWAYQPWHPLSRGLLAHELTHVAQQRLGRETRHDEARDAFVSGAGHEARLTGLVNDRRAGWPDQHWAALDTGRRGLTPTAPGLRQRCVAGCRSCQDQGGDAGLAPADSLTRKKERLAQLDTVIANPASSLGQVAAAKAERMDVEQDIGVLERGYGPYVGNQATDKGQARTPAPKLTDCTLYTLQVLRETFTAKGQADAYDKIFRSAKQRGGKGLRGTDMIDELRAQAGWKVLYWNPDRKYVPADVVGSDGRRYRGDEHAYTAKVARSKGTYYDIPIEKDKMVVDFAPQAGTGTTQDTSGLDHLRRVPFGVIAIRGGNHIAMLVAGQVHEVHWDKECTDKNLIEVTPLENWQRFSGILAAPAADVDAAWRTTP